MGVNGAVGVYVGVGMAVFVAMFVLMAVAVIVLARTNGGYGQIATEYALQAHKRIGNFAHHSTLAAHEYYFQAIFLVNMHMHGGYNFLEMLVLNAVKAIMQIIVVMVEYNGQSAKDKRIGVFHLLLYEGVSYKITNGFRSIAAGAAAGGVIVQ